jgi:hypothetical protein
MTLGTASTPVLDRLGELAVFVDTAMVRRRTLVGFCERHPHGGVEALPVAVR